MDRETRVTVPPGAGAVPPEGRASGAPDAQTAAAYQRAAGQRCGACNAPDSEPVRVGVENPDSIMRRVRGTRG
jgi:hypothetical protein